METRTGAAKRAEPEVESIEAQKAAQLREKQHREEQERAAQELRRLAEQEKRARAETELREKRLRDEADRVTQEKRKMAEQEKSLSQLVEALTSSMQQIAADNKQFRAEMARLLVNRETSAPSTSGFSDYSTPRKDNTVIYHAPPPSSAHGIPEDDANLFIEPQSRTVPEISLSRAVSVVPTFDGDNMNVMQFIRAVKRACDMVPSYAEEDLVKLIIGGLQGRAYRVMEDTQCTSAFKLCETLRKRFEPGRALLQYKCDMSNIYRKRGEHMIDYTGRVKDLRCALVEATRKENGQVDAGELAEIDTLTRQSYIRGLPPSMRDKLSRRSDLTLSDLYELGYDVFEEYARDCRLHGSPDDADKDAASKQNKRRNDKPRQTSDESCSICNKQGHTADRCWRNRKRNDTSNNGQNDDRPPRKTCTYCKFIGHEYSECRKRQRNESNRQQGNDQGSPKTADSNRDRAQAKTRPLHLIQEPNGSE